MTDISPPDFTIPASVHGYLSDPAIRAGVDALLDVKPDALPPELGWEEFEDYLSARAAAELTKSEWPIMLLQLWNSIWKPNIGADWKFSSFDALTEDDYAVSPADCWDNNWMQLRHQRGPHLFYTLVHVDARKTTIGFSIETEADALLDHDVGEFVWRIDDEWFGWLTYSVSNSPADPNFELAALQEQARRALEYVHEAIAGPVES